MANGWFGHLFSTARFRLGTVELENINDIGVCVEIMQQLTSDEYRKLTGEDAGFISDSGTGTAAKNLVAGARTAIGS